MSKLQCLIIDDEPVARRILREYISDINFLELAGEAESASELGAFFTYRDISLIFLDIQMPGMNGIEFLRTRHPDTMTVMTTAYPDYALQGYELDVLDYLVKPISFDRFLKAAQKAREFKLLKTQAERKDRPGETILIKCDRKIERIPIGEILYVEGLANYLLIHTTKRKFITYMTFGAIEEKLPMEQFARIHKSYLIPIPAVTSIDGCKATLGNTVLPISRFFKRSAMKKINQLISFR